jgi:hypothetical protein
LGAFGLFLVIGYIQQRIGRDDTGHEGMKRSRQQEADEVSDVTSTDAGSNPWAMMIVYLDAKAAFVAMEASWRSQNIAGLAVRELPRGVVFSELFIDVSACIFLCGQMFKFLYAIKLFGI